MSRRARATACTDADVLREIQEAQDALVAALRVGYGDPRRRDEIERLRARLVELERGHPDVYAYAEELRKGQKS